MEREYHNLDDYFTTKYPRHLECEALEAAPEFRPLLNKLYELFKGMKISDNDYGGRYNNEINDPRKISDPWEQVPLAWTPPPYHVSILCIEMSELADIKGFSNYDEGIFKFGFSKITPEIFINDIQKILENNPELKSVGAIFRKYAEIKTPLCVINLIKSRDNQYDLFKKRINDLHINLEKKAVLVEDYIEVKEENEILKGKVEDLEGENGFLKGQIEDLKGDIEELKLKEKVGTTSIEKHTQTNTYKNINNEINGYQQGVLEELHITKKNAATKILELVNKVQELNEELRIVKNGSPYFI